MSISVTISALDGHLTEHTAAISEEFDDLAQAADAALARAKNGEYGPAPVHGTVTNDETGEEMEFSAWTTTPIPAGTATYVVIGPDGIRHTEPRGEIRDTLDGHAKAVAQAIALGSYGAGDVTVEITVHGETRTVEGTGPGWATV